MNRLYALLTLAFFAALTSHAQRGVIIIPPGAQISVPAGAQICADNISANNPGFGALNLAAGNGLCAGGVITPVELLSFSAVLERGAVILAWVTASEINCEGFEVHRSPDRTSWTTIGFVKNRGADARGNSYRFEDPFRDAPLSRLMYYRLRMVDADGSFEYSDAVEVRFDETISVPTLSSVYPNPAANRVAISFFLPEESIVDIGIYDISGAAVGLLKRGETAGRGSHVFQASVKDLPSGTYMVELAARGWRSARQVVVRK